MLRNIILAVVAIVVLFIILVLWGVIEIGEEAVEATTEPEVEIETTD